MLKRVFLSFCAVMLAGVFSSCALMKKQPAPQGTRVVLAKELKPAATIVLQANAPDTVRKAAQDLRNYIYKISGVELPLRQDGAKAEGFGLYIGACGPTKESDFPAKSLNPEAYSIQVRPEGIYFTGNYPSPTAFAVYSFLEEDLGVRWFAPGELWEMVPHSPFGELECRVRSRVVEPGTSARIWSGHNWTADWNDWNIRNKTVQSEKVPLRNFQNRIYRILPPEKYAKEHPEYYPLCNGKRYIPPKGYVYWRPCESNPEVQKIIVDYICDYFDKHPDCDSFSVGMDDVNHLCACPNCRAMDAHPDDYENKRFSTRHYKFVNAIAKEVAKRHPDRFIGTLIYAIALDLPEGVDKLEPNVFGYITETCAYWWKKGQKEHDHQLTREWAKRCSHLCRYDYYGFASMTPRYTPHFVDEQMKFDKALGMSGMYIEVYTFLPLTAPMIWQTAKLQWDASQNTDALLDNFMDIYGSAKPGMAKFWQYLEKCYMDPREEQARGKWEHRNLRNQALAINPKQLKTALQLLDQADAMTSNPKVHARIDVHRGALRLAAYAVNPLWLSWEAAQIKVNSARSADKVFDYVKRVQEATAGRDEYLKELEGRQDLLGDNYRALTSHNHYMMIGNFVSLEAALGTAMSQAIAWYAEHQPAKLAEKAEALGKPGTPMRELAMAYAQMLTSGKPPVSLLVNGDFESQKKDEEAAELDWSKEGVPYGWSGWSNMPGTIFGLSGDGYRGSKALVIASARGNACVLQNVKGKPGDRFLLQGWMRAQGKGNVGIGIRFRMPDGSWHKDRTTDIGIIKSAASIPDWQPIALCFTMPAGADKAVVMLDGKNQENANDKVWYDDFAIYPMP